MNEFFKYFETTNRQEREQIADNLKRLYNQWYKAEQETYAELRDAKIAMTYTASQMRYIDAMAKLGAIQAVFVEMGINFDGLFEGV